MENKKKRKQETFVRASFCLLKSELSIFLCENITRYTGMNICSDKTISSE